jgi:hypothetical protein
VGSCVAPQTPIGPDGDPKYDLMATLQYTAEVMQETSAAFMQGAAGTGGVDPWSMGGGLLGGLAMAALAAWRKVSAIRKEQERLITEALYKMPPTDPPVA